MASWTPSNRQQDLLEEEEESLSNSFILSLDLSATGAMTTSTTSSTFAHQLLDATVNSFSSKTSKTLDSTMPPPRKGAFPPPAAISSQAVHCDDASTVSGYTPNPVSVGPNASSFPGEEEKHDDSHLYPPLHPEDYRELCEAVGLPAATGLFPEASETFASTVTPFGFPDSSSKEDANNNDDDDKFPSPASIQNRGFPDATSTTTTTYKTSANTSQTASKDNTCSKKRLGSGRNPPPPPQEHNKISSNATVASTKSFNSLPRPDRKKPRRKEDDVNVEDEPGSKTPESIKTVPTNNRKTRSSARAKAFNSSSLNGVEPTTTTNNNNNNNNTASSTASPITGSPKAPPKKTVSPKTAARKHKTHNSSAQQQQQLNFIDGDPTNSDVMCGRGGGPNSHPGNHRYLDLVRNYQDEYQQSNSSSEKYRISQAIVDEIHGYQGRFVKKDSNTGKWYEMSDHDCRKKVGHALRDGQNPEDRQKKREKFPSKRKPKTSSSG